MYKSFNSAITVAQKLDKVRSGGVVANGDLYTAFEKDPKNEKDRDHVSAMVSLLKFHHLITVQKTNAWPKRRVSVTFTKKAIDILEGRGEPDENPAGRGDTADHDDNTAGTIPMSLQDIANMVKEWNRQNPSFLIDPTPKLIDKEMPVEH